MNAIFNKTSNKECSEKNRDMEPNQSRGLVNVGNKKQIRIVYRLISNIYTWVFSRPSAQSLNNVILQLALKGQGYNNYYDSKTTGEDKFITRIAESDPKLCIDIGANKGLYSRALLETTNATVFAFEPLPKAFKELLKIKSIYSDRFEPVNVGVGIKSGMLDLHYGSEDSEHASFSDEVKQVTYVGAQNVNKISVPVITLDDYYNKNIKEKYKHLDLLKIDAEGFEYEVLRGAQQTILELRPKYIQIEYNWHQLFRNQSLKKLSELIPGYNAYQFLPFGSGLIMRDINRPESNIYHYSNFVFVREDVLVN
jgi:FkbM family methyltransferase